MKNEPDHVVVIGAGVIGAFCAWFLARDGRRVTLVDSKRFGSGCSHANCGYVCPSHVLPLPGPGVIGKTLPLMFQRNAPFKIRWRTLARHASWFYRFAQRCNERAMLESARARYELLNSSMLLYQELLESDSIQCEFEKRGLLFVYSELEEFKSYRETNSRLSELFGIQATPYEGDALCELEPALKSGLGGGWHYEGDCHLKPDLLMKGLRAKLDELNVDVREEFKVDSFQSEEDRVRAIGGPASEIEADGFVVATGALTPQLNRQMNCRIPIQPGKGYTLTMDHPESVPKIPMILESHRVAITPFHSSYRIGSTMEFAGYDDTLNQNRLQLLRDGAAFHLRHPFVDGEQTAWCGWRPMTPDGVPYIDVLPSKRNVWLAAGHNMLGLSMGPATGKLIAELVGRSEPHIDPSSYRIR